MTTKPTARRRGPAGVGLAGLLLLLQAPALAWAGPGPGPGADPGAHEGTPAEQEARRQAHDKLRNEVMDQMRAMRMWKLTEELKLDQTTAATVFPLLAQFDEKAREIGRERREIGREVFAQTKNAKPDDAKLRQLIDRLLANQVKRNALDEERFKALRPALTALQQAKLLLLLPRLEDDFRRRIRDAMDAQRRRDFGAAEDDAAPGRRPERFAKPDHTDLPKGK